MPTTKELERQAQQAAQLRAMDAEFEIEVANAMGPIGRKSIDASKAKVLPTSRTYDVKAFYLPEDYPLNEADIAEQRRIMSPALRTSKYGNDPSKWRGGEVRAVGAGQATPQNWAHEFRHAAGMGEREVRLLDAYFADTKKDWDTAVRRWKEYEGYSDLATAERQLVRKLRMDNTRIQRRITESGVQPPKKKFLWMEYEGSHRAPWKRHADD